MVGIRNRRQKKTSDDEDEYMPSTKKKQAPLPSPDAKKPKRRSMRCVQFDNNPPQIHDITPLTQKPPGLVRMPIDNVKSYEEDMQSPPPTNENALLDNFALPPSNSQAFKIEAENDEEQSNHSVEVIPDETIFRPPKKIRVDFTEQTHPVPRLQLEKPPPQQKNQQQIIPEKDVTNATSSTTTNGKAISKEPAHTFNRGATQRPMANRQLWSHLFAPITSDDFFSKSAWDHQQLREWLGQWRDRMDWLKESAKREEKKKRKRRRSTFDMEAAEEDEDFHPIGEQLNNPIVLEGPTGCGKSAMVYATARANDFEVIEISTFEARDGQTLKNKLAGALESHNVQRGRQSDIRTMFSPNQQNSSPLDRKRKSSAGFSLILVDECDLIFGSDHNFWPTIKDICAQSRIPIVLTCNDYGYVGKELNREPALDNYKTIHMELPPTRIFANYLQSWLHGITGHFHKIGPLHRLIERKSRDPRAVLNELQLGGVQDHRGQTATKAESDQRIATSVSEMGLRTRMLAEADSVWGQTGDGVSFRAKQTADLDFAGILGSALTQEEWEAGEQQLDGRRAMRQALFQAIKMDSELEEADGSQIQARPKEVVPYACTCTRGRLHSMRALALDLLSCMCAIHRRWEQEGKQKWRRPPPHPFEEVDPASGTMIDGGAGQLKVLVPTFSFRSS